MDYDWDSVVAGRPELNSSQNFFRVRHALHEKGVKVKDVQILNKIEKGVKKPVPASGAANASKRPNPINADKENVQNNGGRAILAVSLVTKKQASEMQKINSKPSILRNVLKKSMSVPSAPVSAQPPKPKPAQGVPTFKKPATNIGERQHAYAETIRKHKEELAKRIKQMEEKELKYKFQAKAVPKFIAKRNVEQPRPVEEKKPVQKQQSLPTMTLTRKTTSGFPSCGDPEKLKILKAKRDAMSNYKEAPVQFKAKPAAVLTKRPFQPVHHAKVVADQKPFKLQLTERLLQRSEFDKQLHEKIAKRKQHEENLMRQQELENRKLIRQKTEFKARPNPFGFH